VVELTEEIFGFWAALVAHLKIRKGRLGWGRVFFAGEFRGVLLVPTRCGLLEFLWGTMCRGLGGCSGLAHT